MYNNGWKRFHATSLNELKNWRPLIRTRRVEASEEDLGDRIEEMELEIKSVEKEYELETDDCTYER